MSFLKIFKKKQTETNSSESSYASDFSDQVLGDYVIKKSRDAVVQEAESLWDCRDRMLLGLCKIKTEVCEDEAKIQPEDAPIIVEEFHPDTKIVDLQDSVSSQTIDQSTDAAAVTYNPTYPTTDKSQQMSRHESIVVEGQPDTSTVDLQGSVSSQTIDQSTDVAAVTYNPTYPTTDKSQQMSSHESIVVEGQPDTSTVDLQGSVLSQTIDQSTDAEAVSYKSAGDKSQQMGTESGIKHVEKKTKLANIAWDESCMSMKEYSAYNSMVDKLCQLQTSTEYPKHVKKRVFAPSYCSSNSYPCQENMVPVHKIAYGVSVLVKQVLETRQLLERCLQQTGNQAAGKWPEIQFRLNTAVAETKHLAGKLKFLAIDVNHTTGTPDQIEMLIDVYDACFRRFKKIMKIVRRIEMPEQKNE